MDGVLFVGAWLVRLAALLHDVDDHKYGGSSDGGGGRVEDVLLACDCPAVLARAVDQGCDNSKPKDVEK